MREIKFRYVYKREDGEDLAIYAYTLDEITDGKPLSTLNVLNGLGGGYYGIETTLQFTGLLDNTGVEIYESDYCKYRNGEEYSKAVIEFMDGAYILATSRGHHSLHGHHFDIEVIGNIFEHPELLES